MVQRNLSNATRGLNNAIEQLTTGYKLNHSKDNPANYAMMKNMESKLRAWDVASDNISIGYNMLETADSNAELIGNHLVRIRDLCEQAANGTYGENSIRAIKSEISARVDEIKRIKENAEFNDIKLFGEQDSEGNVIQNNINIQVGIDGSESSRIAVDTSMNIKGLEDIETWDITDAKCLDKIDGLLDEVSAYQVRIGASQNRLECALELAEINTRNLTSSISTIRDADIAKVSSDYIRYQILQQACATLLATANQMPAIALQLI
jgi:flagellin